MVSYEVDFAKSVRKDFKKIPKTEVSRILGTIKELSKNPRSSNSKKLKGEKLYRIRVGNYRVFYSIQDSVMLVFFVKLCHKGDIY